MIYKIDERIICVYFVVFLNILILLLLLTLHVIVCTYYYYCNKLVHVGETQWLSGKRAGFWICWSQVQIPAVTLCRRVITLSKLFTHNYSVSGTEGLKMVCVTSVEYCDLRCQR